MDNANDESENDETHKKQTTGPDSSSTEDGLESISSDSGNSHHKQFKGPHTVVVDSTKNSGQRVNTQKLLQEKQEELSYRDILISTLQDQMKKMLDLYKKNLDDSQALRYKFCRTTQELTDIKKICSKYEEENKKLRKKDPRTPTDSDSNEFEAKSDDDKWKKQYEELLKKIDLMERNTLIMRDLLEAKEPISTFSLPPNNSGLNDLSNMYRNIEQTLIDHNHKFDMLAQKLQVDFRSQAPSDGDTQGKAPIGCKRLAKVTESLKTENVDLKSQINELEKLMQNDISKLAAEPKRDLEIATDKETVEAYRQKLLNMLEEKENTIKKLQDDLTISTNLKDELYQELSSSKEKFENEISRIQTDNENLRDELVKITDKAEDCLMHIKEIEKKNSDIKQDLFKAMEDRDNNLKELMKLQSELEIGSEALKQCLTELNDLKEENSKNCENQEENENLRNKINTLMDTMEEYKEELELMQIENSRLKEKGSNHSESQKKQEIIDQQNQRIENLEAECEELKKRGNTTQNQNSTCLHNKCAQLHEVLQEKDKNIVELTKKISELEEHKNSNDETSGNLRIKYLEANEELEKMKKNIKYLETDMQNMVEQSVKLKKELDEALKELSEYKQQNVSFIAPSNTINVKGSKKLSTYLREQLKEATEQFEKIPPISNICCTEELADLIMWLKKENLDLRTTQNTLIQNLQDKLAESRSENNFGVFATVKELLSVVVSESDKIGEQVMPEKLKHSLEQVISSHEEIDEPTVLKAAQYKTDSSSDENTELSKKENSSTSNVSDRLSKTSSKGSTSSKESTKLPMSQKNVLPEENLAERKESTAPETVYSTRECQQFPKESALLFCKCCKCGCEFSELTVKETQDFAQQTSSFINKASDNTHNLSPKLSSKTSIISEEPNLDTINEEENPENSLKVSLNQRDSLCFRRKPSCSSLCRSLRDFQQRSSEIRRRSSPQRKESILKASGESSPCKSECNIFSIPEENISNPPQIAPTETNSKHSSRLSGSMSSNFDHIEEENLEDKDLGKNDQISYDIQSPSEKGSIADSKDNPFTETDKLSEFENEIISNVHNYDIISPKLTNTSSIANKTSVDRAQSPDNIIKSYSPIKQLEKCIKPICKNRYSTIVNKINSLENKNIKRENAPKCTRASCSRLGDYTPPKSLPKLPMEMLKSRDSSPKSILSSIVLQSPVPSNLETSSAVEKSPSPTPQRHSNCRSKISPRRCHKLEIDATQTDVEVQIQICKGTSYKCTTKLDEQLENLTKMEKQVGNLRKELSANKATNCGAKIDEEELHRRLKMVKERKDKLLSDLGKIQTNYKCSNYPSPARVCKKECGKSSRSGSRK